ncbi:SDR family NAD(P)-dependent oxidoreductase [Alcanivorax sp.]|uniref:SDR family NAD(P)-dependent oxidoreductase n=1 Tax=Alcanivorax sp. TaxID=1872427 RepID=UPI003BA84F28
MTSESLPYPVLITGASSGIGLALTHLHLSRGDHVIASSRQPDHSPLATLNDHNDRLRLIPADLATAQGPASLAAATAGYTDHLSRVIHCAGVLHDSSHNRSPRKSAWKIFAQKIWNTASA